MKVLVGTNQISITKPPRQSHSILFDPVIFLYRVWHVLERKGRRQLKVEQIYVPPWLKLNYGFGGTLKSD